VLWDRATGVPVSNAIVWQCRVTAGLCDRLKAAGHEPTVRARTGLVLDAYFSASKIKHLLDTTDGLRARAARGEVLFGTIDSFLIWRLTGGRVHVTDESNASRTLLYNIHQRRWDDDAAGASTPRQMLPEVRASSEVRRHGRGSVRCAHSHCRAPAISRRRCSARRASSRARPSAPTAPAPSS
jgi:glycerol kinase